MSCQNWFRCTSYYQPFCCTFLFLTYIVPKNIYDRPYILNFGMGKRGIEPPMFTAWERIYSPPQHLQSLPLPQNWNTRNRTRDSPDISRKLYHWAMFQNCICQLHDVLGDMQAPASLYVDGELRRLRQGTTLLIQSPAAILLYREWWNPRVTTAAKPKTHRAVRWLFNQLSASGS